MVESRHMQKNIPLEIFFNLYNKSIEFDQNAIRMFYKYRFFLQIYIFDMKKFFCYRTERMNDRCLLNSLLKYS